MNEDKLTIDLLDGDSALQAIEKVGEIADSHQIKWALCGGIAMVIYGSPRLTKDVDIIASSQLPLAQSEIIGHLKQGGDHFKVETSKQAVSIDWILRNDEAKKFYQEALKDSVILKSIPILTPEWLVILKYIAGRFKDQEDAVFLLSQKELVNRQKIKELFIRVAGQDAWGAVKFGLQRWYDLADGETKKNDSDLIDS
ncbi:MAG TPA: hypothetical protein PKY82_30985 [Pyrinomonadaceae bacterium]|nr:hypothetical protein [Pyrinomonadaceae bacterium]